MEKKWILWVVPENKKLKYTQFWTEAPNMQDAMLNLKNTADFKYRVLGVTDYMNITQASVETKLKAFINNSFH